MRVRLRTLVLLVAVSAVAAALAAPLVRDAPEEPDFPLCTTLAPDRRLDHLILEFIETRLPPPPAEASPEGVMCRPPEEHLREEPL